MGFLGIGDDPFKHDRQRLAETLSGLQTESQLRHRQADKQLQQSEMGKMKLHDLLGRPGGYEIGFEDYVQQQRGEGQYGNMDTRTPKSLFSKGGRGKGRINAMVASSTLKDALEGKGDFRKLDKDDALNKVLKDLKVNPNSKAAQKWLQNPDHGLFKHGKRVEETGWDDRIRKLKVPGAIKGVKAAEFYAGTRAGRMTSYILAQADQLVRQEGPLWNSLQQSTYGQIIEGGAAIMREQAQVLSEMAARGGSSRRQAVAEIAKIQAMESVNTQKQQQLWQANLALEDYTTRNAKSATAFVDAWVNSLPGFRDQYTAMMTHNAEFYTSTTMPMMAGFEKEKFELNLSQKQGGYKALLTMVGMIAGGPLMAQLGGAIGGMGDSSKGYTARNPGLDSAAESTLAFGDTLTGAGLLGMGSGGGGGGLGGLFGGGGGGDDGPPVRNDTGAPMGGPGGGGGGGLA